MRRNLYSRRQLPMAAQMDMVPMIDIILQLLIFFILTSSFTTQPGIKIHLPKAVTSEMVHKEPTSVSVSKDNRLYLGSKIVTLQELRSHLSASAKKDDPILIRSDRQASMGRIVEVWDLCRSLGIQQVNIATSSTISEQARQTR